MAEFEVAGEDVVGNRSAILAALKEMSARPLSRQQGVAGSVDAVVDGFRLPSGERIELWSDNYTPLSLRGEADLVRQVAEAAGVELADG